MTWYEVNGYNFIVISGAVIRLYVQEAKQIIITNY